MEEGIQLVAEMKKTMMKMKSGTLDLAAADDAAASSSLMAVDDGFFLMASCLHDAFCCRLL